MTNYIDGYIFPLPRKHLEEYKRAAEQIAAIWKEYGALSYSEFVGDDMKLEGTQAFPEVINTNEDEVIVFGWVMFASKEARDLANKRVPEDARMADLVGPLVDPSKMIFDASRMVYGGFKPLVL
ncbi:MAG: DUF1428 domain-containing protein [Bacteroidota bacterium]